MTDIPAISTAPSLDVPHRTGWREVLAFAALAALVVQALGGVALSFHYVPSTDMAHASLQALEQDTKYGVSLRALHWLGASAVVGLVMLNLLLAFLAGDHKRPGRGAWVSGVLVLFVVLGFGITGELLPWTEQGVFATEVRTGLIAKAPGGAELHDAILGGDTIAEPALTRFHVLHVVVLPVLLLLLCVWHARARRKIGRPQFVTLPQAFAGLVVTAGLAYGARELRAPLGAVFVDGDAGYEAWPEWYFLWLNKLLKLFPPALEALPAFWIPNGLAVLLLALPFVDVRRARSWRDRPLATFAAIAGVLLLAGLSIANHLDRPHNDPTLPYSLDLDANQRLGYQLVRQQNCVECHKLERDGIVYGKQDHDAPDLDDMNSYAEWGDLDGVVELLRDPKTAFGHEDMPAYDHVPYEGLRAIARYLAHLNR